MKPPLSSSSLLRKTRLSPYLFTLLAFILFVAILYGEDFICIFSQPLQLVTDLGQPVSRTGKKWEKLPFAIGKTDEGCDVFSGSWVRDETRPLYQESDCPYIQPQLTCQEHGRPEKDYQYWRWQPYDCSLPRRGCTRSGPKCKAIA